MVNCFLHAFSVGSMVPFSMRILQAELPQYMGRARDALDNLYELQRTCAQVLKNLQGNLMEDGGQGEMTPENRMGNKYTLAVLNELRQDQFCKLPL